MIRLQREILDHRTGRASRGTNLPVLIRLGISAAGALDDRLRSEQIRMLYRGGPIGVLVAGTGAFMLGGMVLYLGAIPKGATYVWLAVVAADVASHLLVARAYLRTRPAEADWLPWARVFTVLGPIKGLIWGASGFILEAPEPAVN